MQQKTIRHPLDGNQQPFLAWASRRPEMPQAPHLVAYGAISFLAVRDRFASGLTNHALRGWCEPAVLTGQFAVTSQNETPRAMISWAHLDDADHEKMIETFEPPPLEAWFRGRNLWIMIVLCPYRQLRVDCLNWIRDNVAAESFHALRIGRDGRRSLCHYRRSGRSFAKTRIAVPPAGEAQ